LQLGGGPYIPSGINPPSYETGKVCQMPERFEPMRANVNRALAFSGLAVDAAGQIYAVDRAQTLSEAQRRADELRADLTTRGVHPDVLRFCRAELVADNYFHAVLEATKSIADKLRVKSGLSEDGAKLVDATLCGSAPRIAINDLLTDSQRSEQSGFANLLTESSGCSEIRLHTKLVFYGA
jgi:transcriptional regulator of aromatic amino acid metabolism